MGRFPKHFRLGPRGASVRPTVARRREGAGPRYLVRARARGSGQGQPRGHAQRCPPRQRAPDAATRAAPRVQECRARARRARGSRPWNAESGGEDRNGACGPSVRAPNWWQGAAVRRGGTGSRRPLDPILCGLCEPCRRTPAISQADRTGMQGSYTKCPVPARGNSNKAGLRPKRLRRAEPWRPCTRAAARSQAAPR